jgi:tRNA(Ile2)-agmatinylcytidine synthase
MLFHLGLDDTDNGTKGGCTTHLGYLLVRDFGLKGIKVVDFPRLLRLNPNIPWKTRGNGAVGISVLSEDTEGVLDLVDARVRETAEKFNSKPAYVLLDEGQRHTVYVGVRNAVTSFIELETARFLAEKAGCLVSPNPGPGLVGALYAASNLLTDCDHTYELIAYRKSDNIGKARFVSRESVQRMDRIWFRSTFSNLDGNRVLITPHGPDPVLYGIRGENPADLVLAMNTLKTEEAAGWMVYLTNQATDAHYRRTYLDKLRLWDSVELSLTVASGSRRFAGGGVILPLTDGRFRIYAIFYPETGFMREVAIELAAGDKVKVMGGFADPFQPAINVEKMVVNLLVPRYRKRNPKCDSCGRTLESEGGGRFRCLKCGLKGIVKNHLLVIKNARVTPGLYIPPIRYFRHLMKPPRRLGREKSSRTFLNAKYTLFR